MYRIGEAEIKRMRKLIDSGRMFRYGSGGECDRFEAAWSRRLGVEYVRMTNSGTSAIYAGLVGLGVGPGDQVVVPSYTYMATALAVVTCGAIPVVADVDESLTLSPKDFKRRITKHTKAVIPVHMVGLPCNMAEIAKIARKRGILVLEDACQAVGGGYEGQMLGSIGDVGAFSFNFFKNMTCGEGGAFVAHSEDVFNRGSVAVDCCSYYWNPQDRREELQFAGHNFRASEFQGAILNVQLRRIDGMLGRMRDHKKALLEVGQGAGLTSIVNNSLDYECGTHLGFRFAEESQARGFSKALKAAGVACFLPMDTGRHVYTRWDPIMRYQGAHHAALNPFELKENKKARVKYSKKMCRESLDILNRSVLIGMHPDNSKVKVRRMGQAIEAAAQSVLAQGN